jgi:hypothetical protein
MRSIGWLISTMRSVPGASPTMLAIIQAALRLSRNMITSSPSINMLCNKSSKSTVARQQTLSVEALFLLSFRITHYIDFAAKLLIYGQLIRIQNNKNGTCPFCKLLLYYHTCCISFHSTHHL